LQNDSRQVYWLKALLSNINLNYPFNIITGAFMVIILYHPST
jgi:hypothetical protein